MTNFNIEYSSFKPTLYDKLANNYDTHYRHPIHQIEDDFVYDLLRKRGLLNGIILDIGCGTGNLLDNARLSNWKYTGIDISKEMLYLAQMKHKSFDFKHRDIVEYRIDQHFDNIICLFGGMSYVQNQNKAIDNIYHSLVRGGKFMLMYCGKDYYKRKTYIGNQINQYALDNKEYEYNDSVMYEFTDEELLNNFSKFRDVEIINMSSFISERLCELLPFGLSKKYFDFERTKLSKLLSSKFYYKIIIGKK